MNFARETVTPELLEELKPYLFAHYKEIARYQDIELSPDWEAYQNLAKFDLLRVYTIRIPHCICTDGTQRCVCNRPAKLHGYAVFTVRKALHYSTSIQASQDILYLDPQYRARMMGYRFIKWCDDQLRNEGVQVVYHHTKSDHNFGPMLQRQGYELMDHIYAKRLDREPEGEG